MKKSYWRIRIATALVVFTASAMCGVAAASGSSAYSHTACAVPTQAAYGDNYYTTSNYYWWNVNTTECGYPNPYEYGLHGAGAVLWSTNGICLVSDYVYGADNVWNANSGWGYGGPCGVGWYATGGGHRTFDNWTWKEFSGGTSWVGWW